MTNILNAVTNELLFGVRSRLTLEVSGSKSAGKDDPMSCVENLATFVCRSAYEHLSETARKQLKIRMLDSLRCEVGALEGEPVQILRGPEEDWATYSEEDKDRAKPTSKKNWFGKAKPLLSKPENCGGRFALP